MDEKSENQVENTNLKISEGVIATIAKVATLDVSGVYGLVSFRKSILGLINKNRLADCIKIELTDEIAAVSIYLKLKYGAVIQETAFEVQKKVKDAVQSMTGIHVSRVNVIVSDIYIDKNEINF